MPGHRERYFYHPQLVSLENDNNVALDFCHDILQNREKNKQLTQRPYACTAINEVYIIDICIYSFIQLDGVSPASDEPSSRDVTQDRSSPSQVPRPILVKFVSRRVKDDVMKSRKELKGKKLQDTKGHMSSVFVQDDLTQRRAYLAFQVRQMKRNKQILDTWVSYGKIMAKDNHSRIVTINSTRDLSKLNWGN